MTGIQEDEEVDGATVMNTSWTCLVSDITSPLDEHPMISSSYLNVESVYNNDTMTTTSEENFNNSCVIVTKDGDIVLDASTENSETFVDDNIINHFICVRREELELINVLSSSLSSSEDQTATEEIVFGDGRSVFAFSADDSSIANDDDDGSADKNFYIEIQTPNDFEGFGDGENSIIIDNMVAFSLDENVVTLEYMDENDETTTTVSNSSDVNVCRPRIVSNILVHRCSLCNCQYFKEEAGLQHLKRLHPRTNALLRTDVVAAAYVCVLCNQLCRDNYRWQVHMKKAHNIVVDRRRRCSEASLKRNAAKHKRTSSWRQNKKFPPIECLVCGNVLHLMESYYLHVRKKHRTDALFKDAMQHLQEVRTARRKQINKIGIECIKCGEMLDEHSVISHLQIFHSDDPYLNEMITTTKTTIKETMKTNRLSRDRSSASCPYCQKQMRKKAMKSHLEFHCRALVQIKPNDETRKETLLKKRRNNDDDDSSRMVLIRKPRMTRCEECDKTMTIKSFYHHQRRVHRIGIQNAKMYNCSFCKKPFFDQFHLQNHLLMHTRDRAFICLLCKRSFINIISYSEHHRKVHERQFLHACSVCGRGFWKRVDKLRHRCKAQNLALNQLKNDCLASEAKAALNKWNGPFYVEIDRTETEKKAMREKRTKILQNEKKIIICVLCRKSFQSVRYFQSHFRYSHLQDYDLTCKRCGLGFWNNGQMTFHKCQPSRLTFNEKKRNLMAKRTKEALKNFTKPYCYVSGSANDDDVININMRLELENWENELTKKDERLQMKNEDEENRVANDDDDDDDVVNESKCKKPVETETTNEVPVVSLNSDLEKPAIQQTPVNDVQPQLQKETPLPDMVKPGYCLCSICGKELKLKNFYPHMRRVHFDDTHKPIVWKICEECGYKCQDNYKLRRHVMTHKKNVGIECELCGRFSYELMDYNQHFKRRHLGQFTIRCDECAKGFWKMNALQAHNCFPELKEENIQIQKLKEESALKRRDEIRRSKAMNDVDVDDHPPMTKNENVNNAQQVFV